MRKRPELSGAYAQGPIARVIGSESEAEYAVFEGDALEGYDSRSLDLSHCLLQHVTFSQVKVERIYLTDCRFVSCDLTGMKLGDGLIRACEFSQCRMSGCVFDRMKMKDARFEACRMPYALFQECGFERVEFDKCELDDLYFGNCAQKELSITECRLGRAELTGTAMKGVDFSTDAFASLTAAPELLRGAAFGYAQAADVLALLGVRLV